MDNFLNKIPNRIRQYLNERGLSDETIFANKISFDGSRIVIPVFDAEGKIIYNKYRRDPQVLVGAKYSYDPGAKITLYGIQHLKDSKVVVITEGEFDSLILQSKGICAVTSTGGATSFQEEWVDLFKDKDLYVCLDNDKAGLQGKIKIFNLLPFAKNLPLPKDIKDVTDFFIKFNRTIDEFKILMQVAEPPPRAEEPVHIKKKYKVSAEHKTDLEKAKNYPIGNILRFRNNYAECPFHKDKTPSLHMLNNRWHCFSCGQGGDTIDLVMKMNEVSMLEAIKMILRK